MSTLLPLPQTPDGGPEPFRCSPTLMTFNQILEKYDIPRNVLGSVLLAVFGGMALPWSSMYMALAPSFF